VGRNPAGGRARPNSQHPHPHGPAERTRPSRTVQPSQPSPSSQREAKQSRGNRSHDVVPPDPDPDPNFASVRSCLPRTPPQRPVSFLRTTAMESSTGKIIPNKTYHGIFPKSATNASRIFDSVGGDLRDNAPPVLDSLAYK
jgi:hypothetical protein